MTLSETVAAIETIVIDMGVSPWLLLIVLALCCVDGFFPPVPSESVVIAASALAATGAGSASFVVVLLIAAAAGALAGDLIAHAIGRRVPLVRVRVFRGRKGRAALEYAVRSLHTRGSTLILTGRFVPVGRVAVNMMAGAIGYPRRRFMAVASLASVLWAGLSVATGLGSGFLFPDDPILAMAIGIAAGLLAGVVLDALMRVRPAKAFPTRATSADA